ncbi:MULTISPECIES: tail fiber assembly protein [unclassified Enterobacter]|uniref:tail fiber assembly protein n=1 Tax=unclassified Enterobacter TaxID=2608935 RepID=UPI001CBBABE8|nr:MULTISPECIES: tail fiber assembly protein [unclassified Enterobacter]UAN39863.1 tail fiber assembly protein [Enterobacter sp. JBIWA008]UXP25020.1 tail fiber assembly protein [Enterobacter sp. 155105]
MGNYFYSAKKNAFYPVSLEDAYRAANSWPEDGVEVDDSVYLEYSATPPEGKVRVAKDGVPSWADIPPPTHEELVASANAEKQKRIDQANDYMNSKQWPGKAAMGRLKDSEKEQYNAWLDYLDELEAVDTSTAPDIKWPDKP